MSMRWVLCVVFIFVANTIYAAKYVLPDEGNALIGEINYVDMAKDETPTTLAAKFNLGLNAIIEANPGTTERVIQPNDVGAVKLATNHLLPSVIKKGIVINLPEMRLYYYPGDQRNTVISYPIGIGKLGNTIPIQQTHVSRKALNPTWTPGPDVRQFNKNQGIILPTVMQAGPDNPLGPYALYLGIPSYLIHSTIFPESIGRRASFGCIRMNETDIKEFYPIVNAGTPVTIVNIPNKVGWDHDTLYLETHIALEEHQQDTVSVQENIVRDIQSTIRDRGVTLVNWQLMSYLAKNPDGVPHEIGVMVK